MFDAENPNSQLLLTRVLQALANINTRRVVELLAQGPRSLKEMCQFVDLSEKRLLAAMEILRDVELVSEAKSSEGAVYVFNRAGLVLARSWLDRVDSIVGDKGQE
jgi:predicted transcriptional regulator